MTTSESHLELVERVRLRTQEAESARRRNDELVTMLERSLDSSRSERDRADELEVELDRVEALVNAALTALTLQEIVDSRHALEAWLRAREAVRS